MSWALIGMRAEPFDSGFTVKFCATEMTSFEQDDAEVVAVLRQHDGGPERQVRVKYMVAADGTHSFVRGKLGIDMAGRGSFADCVTIYFKADLRALIGGRSLSVVYVNQPGLLAFFRFSITGDVGFLAVFATFDEDGPHADPRARLEGGDATADISALTRSYRGLTLEKIPTGGNAVRSEKMNSLGRVGRARLSGNESKLCALVLSTM
jgi:hypothetical protein